MEFEEIKSLSKLVKQVEEDEQAIEWLEETLNNYDPENTKDRIDIRIKNNKLTYEAFDDLDILRAVKSALQQRAKLNRSKIETH